MHHRAKELRSISQLWDGQWGQIKDVASFVDIERTQDVWTRCHLPLIDNKLRRLSAGSYFLEAGCGMGQWCIYANQKYGVKSLGIDIAGNTVGRMNEYIKRSKMLDVEFLVDDLRDTALPADTFDFFVCLGVIEHFHNPQKLLRNLYKVTKKNGEGLLTVPNVYSFHTFSRPLAQWLHTWHLGYEESFTAGRLRRLVQECGFRVVDAGIIPSGVLFGCRINSLPFVGRFFQRFSYVLESRQKTLGFIRYIWVKK
jgi:SAM-dependent methyltransferase